MKGNEHGQLAKDVIYAELRDENDELVISATLQHVLAAIRDRQLETDGVTVTTKVERGTTCSTVALTSSSFIIDCEHDWITPNSHMTEEINGETFLIRNEVCKNCFKNRIIQTPV